MVGAARPVRCRDREPPTDRGDARDRRRVENRPDERQAAAGPQEVSARRTGFKEKRIASYTRLLFLFGCFKQTTHTLLFHSTFTD